MIHNFIFFHHLIVIHMFSKKGLLFFSLLTVSLLFMELYERENDHPNSAFE